MELALIIFRQTIKMAIFMLIGYLLYKKGKITKEGSGALASLLVWVVIPVTLINSFAVEKTPEKMKLFWITLLIGAAVELISLLIARLFFPRKPIHQFAAAFSNAGYIGIPLIEACFGPEAVFYMVWMILILNILQWTYGVFIIVKGSDTAEKISVSPKSMLLSPIVIAAAAGILIFVTGVGNHLPSIIDGCLDNLAAINGPIAMMVLGVYLAQTNLLEGLKDSSLWMVSLVRLLIIPAVLIAVMSFIPVDPIVRMTILIAGSAPAGANVAVYSQVYHADYTGACRIVTLTTILSIVVLPLVIAVAGNFIH